MSLPRAVEQAGRCLLAITLAGGGGFLAGLLLEKIFLLDPTLSDPRVVDQVYGIPLRIALVASLAALALVYRDSLARDTALVRTPLEVAMAPQHPPPPSADEIGSASAESLQQMIATLRQLVALRPPGLRKYENALDVAEARLNRLEWHARLTQIPGRKPNANDAPSDEGGVGCLGILAFLVLKILATYGRTHH